MATERLALAPTDCYRRNMAALAAFQPSVAATVESMSIPDGVTPATGRDGSNTFLIPADNEFGTGTSGRPPWRPLDPCTPTSPTGGRRYVGRRRVWFGQSSMPAVSAAEVFAGFRGDGRNVALPGVFTGVEPLVVAGKMPAHAALFVLEQSPLQLKLAMHLHDYAELLAAGRLVFVLGKDKDLSESLRTFFEQHIGYELPAHLLPVPQRSAAQIADLRHQLEQAGQAVVAVQARVVESHLHRLRSRAFGRLPSAPRVAVLGVDPRPVSLEQARRVGRALAKLQWPHELCVPDAPGKCHVSARLRAIDRLGADLVLFVNGTADAVQSAYGVLPPDLPVASWYLPGAIVQPLAAATPPSPLSKGGRGGIGGQRVVFASSRALYEGLVGAGVPATGIERCAPAGDDTVYRPVTLSPKERGAVRVDVAVLSDLPDDRPEACNINLASHLALWRALQEAVRRSVDRYHRDIAEELLDEAQRDSGTRLEDAQVRKHFVDLLRARIAPASIARAAAAALVAHGYDVGIWGNNWPAPLVKGGRGVEADIRRGPIPVGDALNRLFNAAGLVLLPDSSPLAVQTALDALAAGACVICRLPDGPFEQEYPGLEVLATHLHLYRTSRELLDAVRRLKRPKAPLGQADTARTMVLTEHTVSQRLRSIVATIQPTIGNPQSAIRTRLTVG